MLTLIKQLLNILGNNYGMAGFMGDDAQGDAGSSGGSDGGSGPGDSGAGNDNGGGIAYSYPDGMDEGLKGNETLLKFADDKGAFNHANIMKSYVHMAGLLGKDKIQVPDETFTDEQWGQLYDKLGRPALEEYGVKNNMAEGIKEDPEFLANFKKTAHEAGILPKQAQKMLDFYNNAVGESYKSSITQSDEYLEAARSEIKNEYGHAYESKLRLANHALDQFATEDQIAALNEQGLLDNPLLTRMFIKVGESLKEDTFNDEATNKAGMTPDDIRAKISSFYGEGHAFMNKQHPNHKHSVDQMLKLQKMLISSN